MKDKPIKIANINFDGLHLVVETYSVEFDNCNLKDTIVEFKVYKESLWQKIKRKLRINFKG
jgi:hypothetical protein